MSLNYILIGKRIKTLRKRQHLTQEVLAEKIDKTMAYISYVENGDKHPSLETLVDIANALQVTPDYLLGDNLLKNGDIQYKELEQLLEGCTSYERRVIIDTIRELKRILRESTCGRGL